MDVLTRRRAAMALVFALTWTLSTVTGRADAAVADAIVWSVDHTAKTITVTLKLEIVPACSGATPRCTVNQEIARVITANALGVWNVGARYKCYEIIVEVDVTVGTDPTAVPDDRVIVRIDRSPVAIRSWVSVTGTAGWAAADPSARLVPKENAQSTTTWAYPPTVPMEYAHEIGHMLGLDDTYTAGADGYSVPIPGAPVDVMNSVSGKVSRENLIRLVRRSGAVDDAELKCDDYRATKQVSGSDAFTSWSILYVATKCDEADGDWTLDGSGTLTGGGDTADIGSIIDFELDEQTLSGPMVGSATFRDVDPGETRNTEGVFEGTATLSEDKNELLIEVVSGEGDGYIYGYLDTGLAQPGTLTLPVETGQFCTEPSPGP